MPKLRALLALAAITLLVSARAQTSADAAVQITASVQSSPGQVTLHWPGTAASTQYNIYRKAKSAATWGSLIAVLSGTATQFTDTITAGFEYEYRISRAASGYSGHGYISCASEIPAVDFRGILLLVIDSTFMSTLSTEIVRLVKDVEGDGWEVHTMYVDRNAIPPHVKSKIVAEYNSDPLNVKAVFLLGHVPVPYSGNLNPDGHVDHQGAWPADVYYGDVNGVWTDVQGPGTSTSSPPRTQNYPGDGKFDQLAVPGSVELQVGRVDLYNMTAFNALGNEEQLLRNYLNKDHAYRKKQYAVKKRGLVDDNFGYFSGEAFAASAYKNFAPLLGPSSVVSADYVTTLDTADYQWSYGCGGGSYTSAGGIGNTAAIAASSLHSTFTMLFGSYFGDWDVQNSFLRAPLASGRVLTNVWSGRPHFQFHHMAMGENIGYSLLATQNFGGSLYFSSTYPITGKWVHTSLMGDPTLRQDIVAPVSNVVATKAGYDCHITWTASPDSAILGYNIYMRNDSVRRYTRLNTQPVTALAYTHTCLPYPGQYEYMVRAITLQNTPSGSYYNMSEGISDTAFNSQDNRVFASLTTSVMGNTLTAVGSASAATSLSLNFGNGQSSPSQSAICTYTANGIYTVILQAGNACFSDTSTAIVTICHWLPEAQFTYAAGDSAAFTNQSMNATSYFWDFGDGQTGTATNPIITYTAAGSYTVMLVAANMCGSDTAFAEITVDPLGLEAFSATRYRYLLYPNPAADLLHISGPEYDYLRVYDVTGRAVVTSGQSAAKTLDVESLSDGVYLLEIGVGEHRFYQRFRKY